jgi:hypothetical protein
VQAQAWLGIGAPLSCLSVSDVNLGSATGYTWGAARAAGSETMAIRENFMVRMIHNSVES